MTGRKTTVVRPIELKQTEPRPKAPPIRKSRLLKGHNAASMRLQVEDLLQLQEHPDFVEFSKLGEDAQELIRRMVSDPAVRDYPFRREAVSALGVLADAQSVALLAALVTNPKGDPVLVGRAADALALIGGAGASELIQRAIAHEDKYARGRAARALCDLAHPASLDSLRKIAREHEDDYLRERARESLGRLGVEAPKSSRKATRKAARKTRVAQDLSG